MSNYQSLPLSRNSLLALLQTDPDPGLVRVSATGQVIPSPAYDERLAGLADGKYEVVERAFPRRFMLESDAWALLGVDLVAGTALVRLDAPPGPRYVSCDLTVRRDGDK